MESSTTTAAPTTGIKRVKRTTRTSPGGKKVTIHARSFGKDRNPRKDAFTPRTTEIAAAKGKHEPPREGSKRAQLLELLRHGGIKLEVGARKFDWSPRDFMDALRLLGKVNGIPTKQLSDGRWVRA